MTASCRERKGLTLLEVLVAILVSAIVLGIAARLLRIVGDTAVRQTSQEFQIGSIYLAIRELALQIDVTAGAAQFTGSRTEVRFASWCTGPGGWAQRCNVQLAVAEKDSACRGKLRLGTDSLHFLSEAPCGLSYLGNADGTGHWAPEWNDAERRPLALQLTSGSDTLLLRIGSRG